MTRRICIVTPDLVGPIKNGGIGTHAFNLALELAHVGNKVTVLFTGPIEYGSADYWRAHFDKLGIVFHSQETLPPAPCPLNTSWFLERSYRIFLYLKERQFDTVNFQEWQANGFHTIQAKRSTKHFQDLRIVVTMHSSSEWINEGNRVWSSDPFVDPKLDWCERYCCTHCDHLTSPSQHMLDWAEAQGWSLCENRSIAPYCYELKKRSKPTKPAPGHIAFFGRLETRKGLSLFINAINDLPDRAKARIRGIHFVGKEGIVDGVKANEFIAKHLELQPDLIHINTDFSSHDAIEYLLRTRCLAVIPSLLDNYPYTVIECCMNGIPLLASNVGGIPEMVGASALFAPNRTALTSALEDVLRGKIPLTRQKYDSQKSAELWQSLLAIPSPTNRYLRVLKDIEKKRPLISICTPYYNYGRYLASLIGSINESTYDNWELIIVNDGSTDPASVKEFKRLSKASKDKRVRFYSTDNRGVGAARNQAASYARGEYLVFMDSDNLCTPTMLMDFLTGIKMSGTDVLTCHFKAFPEELSHPSDSTIPIYAYLPIGPAIEVGWAENVFGDANFIVKRSSFEELGGFTTERGTSWEDWDFLARMSLKGFKQDVIPELLFWYRHTGEGYSRNTNYYLNHRRILRAYSDSLPREMSFMFKNVLVPLRARLELNQVGFRSDIDPRPFNELSPLKKIFVQTWDSLPPELKSAFMPLADAIDRTIN